MRLGRLLAGAIAAVLLLSGSAGAAAWRVPGDFPTIQAAIDGSQVADGDTVLVQAGVRVGATVKKAVILQGRGRVIIADGGNRVAKNRVAVTSANPGLVTASAIELSDTRDLSTQLVIQENDVVYNDLRGSSEPFAITPDELEAVNRIEHNSTGASTDWPDLLRNRAGGEALPPGAAAAPVR